MNGDSSQIIGGSGTAETKDYPHISVALAGTGRNESYTATSIMLPYMLP
ncbi:MULTISPECIES: hypothetical protein [unclassified Oceanobacillus]